MLDPTPRRRPALPLWAFSAVFAIAAPATGQTPNPPLVPFTSVNFPNGLEFGWSLGISCGDYDADGFPDLYNHLTGELWRNLGGQDWEIASNLLSGPVAFRYGSSFGDYDRDGLPDIATEPRKGYCFQLFHNDGGGQFTDIAEGTASFAVTPCDEFAETAAWGDVDFDNDLDLFLPTYPAFVGGTQPNYFWRNNGPVGVGGAYVFEEMAAAVGLLVPVGNNRPEGAQLCDYDFDGDLDLYSNGSLYQNQSTLGQPAFAAMAEAASGIGLSSVLDEGALFFDHDLDGDFDILAAYVGVGVVIWENRGDGTFFQLDPSAIASPTAGVDFGVSAEDWDNDGDLDFNSQFAFRRNMLVETGQRQYVVSLGQLDPAHLIRPTVAWADFDLDGDLDAAIGNFWPENDGTGALYDNALYDASTPAAQRRHLRVRLMRDESFARGSETEFGARAEVRVAGEQGVRRTKFVASGHGYLNQNEYTLHFGIPSAGGATVLDVVAEFPNDPAVGGWRVDRHVNPLLGGLVLEALGDREVVVFRSGRAVVDGCDVTPNPVESPLTASTPALVLPSATAGLVPPVTAARDTFVGIDITTGAQALRVTELVVDGVVTQGGVANVLWWDTTNASTPVFVDARVEVTEPRNDRSYLVEDRILAPQRSYRVVVAVDSTRATPIAAPVTTGGLTTNGGLLFRDREPLSGARVRNARTDPGAAYVSVRFRPALLGVPIDLGNAVPSAAGGSAVLQMTGTIAGGQTVTLAASGLPANGQAFLAIGQGVECLPIGTGTVLVPAAAAVAMVPVSASGTVSLSATWPAGLPTGVELASQIWYDDSAAGGTLATSNVVLVRSP